MIGSTNGIQIELGSVVKTYTLTATTTGTGAIEIPNSIRYKPIIEVVPTNTPYFVYRRDVSYLMVRDTGMSVVANTSVTLNIEYLDI